MKPNKHAVLGALGLVMALVYGRALFSGRETDGDAEWEESTSPKLVSTQGYQGPEYDADPMPEGWGRNPFMPVARDSDLCTVTMIAIGSNGVGSAMIDGQLVRSGERIGNNRVLAILPSSVVVENGQRRYELHLSRQAGFR